MSSQITPGHGTTAVPAPLMPCANPARAASGDVAVTSSVPPPAPRAYRSHKGAWAGGVCTGIAEHLGWSVMLIRAAFVLLSFAQFLGIAVYAALWLLLPTHEAAAQAPGLEANTRTGRRCQYSPSRRKTDIAAMISLVAVALGALWLLQLLGIRVSGALFWPVAFAAVGLGLVWRQADQRPAFEPGEHRHWYSSLLARQGWAAVARIAVGLLFVSVAVSLVIANQTGLEQLPRVLALVVLAVAGVGLVIAPWAYRARRSLRAAHERELLADQRADMAAHLHDSVLQTLALIQRQADDPKAVAALARSQERELRTWLYGEVTAESTLKVAITRAAQEIEDERGVRVEVVCVGDCELDVDGQALVRAAREAMMNAAKHSGAPVIDVYSEAFDGDIEVFVRDRGVGFDPDTIGEDRMGVRRSIIDRLERHGGRAEVRSTPGDGTEVRLYLSR